MREPGRRRFRWTILGAMLAVAVAATSFRLIVLARNARESVRLEQEAAALVAERAMLVAVVARAERRLVDSAKRNERGEISDEQLADEQASLQKARLDFEQIESRLRLLRQQSGANAS